jgi:hypothetical protein
MNKLILGSIFFLGISSATMAGSVEQYVKMVGSANSDFQQSSRSFFKALNPQQSTFSAQQQQQYCQIVQHYVDDLYGAVEKNLDIFRSQKAYTKADVIHEVLSKREMQTLAQYGVECELK